MVPPDESVQGFEDREEGIDAAQVLDAAAARDEAAAWRPMEKIVY